jgi:hypothetical protein
MTKEKALSHEERLELIYGIRIPSTVGSTATWGGQRMVKHPAGGSGYHVKPLWPLYRIEGDYE